MDKTYFYLKDASHGKYLQCGEKYDGKLYLKNKTYNGSSEWTFELVSENSVEKYQIVSKLHGKMLVAGQIQDNHVYHQNDSGNYTAQWAINYVTDYGVTGYVLKDLKHLKHLVAGHIYDGHVYHQQWEEGKHNLDGIWNLEYSSGPYDVIPNFMLPDKLIQIDSVNKINEKVHKSEGKPKILEQIITNNRSIEQSSVFKESTNYTYIKSVTLLESVTETVLNKIDVNIGASIGRDKSTKTGEGEKSGKTNWSVGGSASINYARTWGREIETHKEIHYSNETSDTLSFEYPLQVPPMTKVTATLTLTPCFTTIPFEVKLLYNDLKGNRTEKTIHGYWAGIENLKAQFNTSEQKL